MAANFKKLHVGEWAFHLHHEALVERVSSEGINARIAYIYEKKNGDEIDLRVKLLRIVKRQALINKLHEKWAADNDIGNKTKREILRLHKKECNPDCPWTAYESQSDREFSPDGNIMTRIRNGQYVLKNQGGRIITPDWEEA